MKIIAHIQYVTGATRRYGTVYSGSVAHEIESTAIPTIGSTICVKGDRAKVINVVYDYDNDAIDVYAVKGE